MSQVLKSQNGRIAVDLDELAHRLSMSTAELKEAMQLLALSHLMNEADRLNGIEQWDKKTKAYPYPPMRDSHVIAASKSMLHRPVSESI